MLVEKPRPTTHNDAHHGKCPCCYQEARFHLTGEQRWPRAVAEKAGMPELIRLWTCSSCKSTVSEIDLLFN